MSKNIPDIEKDISSWYTEVVTKAGLADYGPVKGTMVIKPYGFQLWENIKEVFDSMIKKTGHTNAYFPLLIPKSFLAKEAEHVDGFAKECAVVTHTKLKSENNDIVVDPDSRLEEEVIIRPTSETVIWSMYKKWIQSYRDLPILINQWANVVRWEMRTRLFLRTTEFLWQEGHTAHKNKEEAQKETLDILELYRQLAEDHLAIPVYTGLKTDSEKFAGADKTYCIEAMMLDKRALQAGTSHNLGQNFAKAFDVKFTNRDGKQDFVWSTSWGVSTRLMGALIMTHSDDSGLVLPPKLAPFQVVIVPIYKDQDKSSIIKKSALELKSELESLGIRVKFDDRETHKPGWKFAEYELKGVPIRLTIGERDLLNSTIEIARRDTMAKETLKMMNIGEKILDILDDIQHNLYSKADIFKEQNTNIVDNYNEFKEIIAKGGFVYAHWDGSSETEEKIKSETKATIRCIPIKSEVEEGKCVYSGNKSIRRVLFAKSY